MFLVYYDFSLLKFVLGFVLVCPSPLLAEEVSASWNLHACEVSEKMATKKIVFLLRGISTVYERMFYNMERYPQVTGK